MGSGSVERTLRLSTIQVDYGDESTTKVASIQRLQKLPDQRPEQNVGESTRDV
jgi:hypothetical protein